MKPKHKVILIVADGWGYSKPCSGNYICQSYTPEFNELLKKYPHTLNKASGNAVGLPKGSQGNSEVGHLHIGSGRIVWQMYEKINRTIKNKSFFRNKKLIEAMDFAKKNNSNLHLMGLCSDEGVHAHTEHLIALLKMAQERGVKNIFIHFFADGRDVPEKSAQKYVDIVEKTRIGRIASIVGRYYSMDRDNNWERTKEAFDMLILGKGFKAKNAKEAIDMAYKRGNKTDYYIQPTVIVDKNNESLTTIKDNDAVIFFNFRTDRPRQLTHAFLDKKFDKFKREKVPKVKFITFAPYEKSFAKIAAFFEDKVTSNLGETISRNKLKQLRMAETEKYGHVTFFFNSQIEKPYKGEKRILIPSVKVPSYDQKPEMSAYEIANEAAKQIKTGKFDFIVINFANCDLVGHSAVKEAIIKAVQTVDECSKKIIDVGLEKDYTIILTADHGSAEDKLYPDGKAKPSHSTNPINFILISNDKALERIKLKNGEQSDVAPTILELMGLKKPKEMTGKSLIIK